MEFLILKVTLIAMEQTSHQRRHANMPKPKVLENWIQVIDTNKSVRWVQYWWYFRYLLFIWFFNFKVFCVRFKEFHMFNKSQHMLSKEIISEKYSYNFNMGSRHYTDPELVSSGSRYEIEMLTLPLKLTLTLQNI